MREWSFAKLLLVSFPPGLLVGGAFGAIASGLFDHGPLAHVEPMKGLVIGAGIALFIGLGVPIAIKLNLGDGR
jgi:hypothetical protein